jgi:hypothetical protein
VALLADLALLAAAGGKLPLVDAHTVQVVYDELGVMDGLAATVGAGSAQGSWSSIERAAP